jgi:hypothetical protein
MFTVLFFGSLLILVVIGFLLLKRGKTLAGILLLMFLAPVYTSILIQYLNHQFPFG